MNAYELADELDKINDIPIETIINMLRQQADRIEELEKCAEYYRDKYYFDSPAKTLTMTFEEMYPIAEKHLGHAIGLYNWKIFADAILKKASEK